MAKPKDLEKRIGILEDIEAIKKLRARYWRCVDRKLWDELGECFAEDIVLDFHRREQLQGRKFVVRFIEQSLGSATTVNQGHGPDIEITGDTTAKGTWTLDHRVLSSQPDKAGGGWGYYEDEYVKESGKWRIKRQKFVPFRVDWWKEEH